MAHALTAYATKPLHALGVIELQCTGWAERDQTKQFLWDLLFYEPWFFGLGVLVTAATVHHYRRTGGHKQPAGCATVRAWNAKHACASSTPPSTPGTSTAPCRA